MSFEIVVTDNFKKEARSLAKKYRSLKADIGKLIDSLERDPKQGDPLGRDCYKIRMAISSKNKGKSGGSRVITCVKIVRQSVFLLSVYDKKDKDSISERELDKLLKVAGL